MSSSRDSIKDGSLTTRDVKNKSLLGADFKRGQLPAGERGPQGPKGDAGAAGADGTPGTPGSPGSPAASALMGRSDVTLTGSTNFLAPTGSSTPDADESSRTHLSPNAAIVAKDLVVRAYLQTAGGVPLTFTLRDDGADTAVSCTVSNADDTGDITCNSGSATAAIQPGSDISLKVSPGGSNIAYLRWGWRATTP